MSMFCHQCQETAKNTGCTVQGVCGKKEDVANLQDLFIWTLKGISVWGVMGKEFDIYDEEIAFFIDKGLFSTITNANFSRSDFLSFIKEGLLLRERLKKQVLEAYQKTDGKDFAGKIPECAIFICNNEAEILARAASGTGGWLSITDEDERSLKATILYGLKGMSAYAEHAYQLKKHSRKIFEFLMEGLAALVDPSLTKDDLLAIVIKTGQMGVETMALLDSANAAGYGIPKITTVNLGTGKNPGILVTGHDLVDLHDLLEQTKDKGIDIYTHSEMLPAHYYPQLKHYKHLVGNYGNAWWMQKTEIESFHGPILFTSNCIVPPKQEHMDKIFTTGAVGFEGCVHIPDRKDGKPKDFSQIIAKANTCKPPEQIEVGSIVGGFGHSQVLELKDKIIDAVKSELSNVLWSWQAATAAIRPAIITQKWLNSCRKTP